MHSIVSSDWLPSYIKAMRPVLEILKMAGYFLDSPYKWERMQIGLNTIHTDQKLMHTILVPSHSRMYEYKMLLTKWT
jgi:hypothetical protein